jgi:fucose permease
MSPRERLYAVACAAMFVFGMILVLPGTVLGRPETIAQFGLSLADRGLLISALFTGLLVGSFASGPIVDGLGPRRALAISSLLVAVCLPLVAAATTGLLAAAALGALGLVAASINTASNALSSDLFPEERGRRMNGIGIMVGLGGLAMPVATVLVSGLVTWRAVAVAGGVVAAAVAVVGGRLRGIEVAPLPAVSPAAALRRLSREPGFGWFCLLIMLGGGNEASVSGWTSSFLELSGFSAAAATWGLASLWVGFIASRALFHRRVDRNKAYAVTASAACGAVCVLVMVGARAGPVLAVMPFCLGMSIALVMPTALALAGERYPGNPGVLFGALLTLAQVGGMALPAAIGAVAERAGIRAGLALVAGSCGVIVVVVSVLSRPVRGWPGNVESD